VLILLLWQRLGRASVGDKLHAAFLVDYTYPEPLAEFVDTLAWQLATVEKARDGG
jgi:hypothetical protein